MFQDQGLGLPFAFLEGVVGLGQEAAQVFAVAHQSVIHDAAPQELI